MNKRALNQFTGGIVFRTAKAVLFWDYYWEEPQWLPRSAIKMEIEPLHDEVTIQIDHWLCRKNEWIEFTHIPKMDEKHLPKFGTDRIAEISAARL
jgi:hypothetical protein